MIWLAWHMWILLSAVFGLGFFMGWWLFSRRGPRHERVVQRRIARDRQEGKTARPATADPANTGYDAAADQGAMRRPPLYAEPVLGKPDRLTRISGIGPKYELLLNDLGVYYYDQIAHWTPGEIAWLDKRLGFPGRIARDRWPEQAHLILLGKSLDEEEVGKERPAVSDGPGSGGAGDEIDQPPGDRPPSDQ